MSHSTRSDWAWFSVWLLLGLTAAAAAISAGPLVLLFAAAVASFLAYRRGLRRSAGGLLSSAGLLFALLTVWGHQHPAANAPNCGQGSETPSCVAPNHLVEGEWLAIGVALLICGIVIQARRMSRS